MSNFKFKDVIFIVGVLIAVYIVWKIVLVGPAVMFKLSIPIILVGGVIGLYYYLKRKKNVL